LYSKCIRALNLEILLHYDFVSNFFVSSGFV